MCGIVAVLTPDPRFPGKIIDAMRDRLAHRGPDGRGSWLERTPAGGTIALGHRRLSIIDLSADADQPMFSNDGNVAIVYNGEIYNYVELRAELAALGAQLRTKSDTEVLIEAYVRWGHDFLARLNGMFAFVLWDRRKGEMIAARDRFGEKPLYMADLPGGGIAFASEAKALFAHPDIPADANVVAIDDFVAGAPSIQGERTFFSAVRRVLPSHVLRCTNDGRERRSRRYWTPDYTAVRDNAESGVEAEKFADMLVASLTLRLRSDVRVGACLSGGLDSSSLVGFLSKMKAGSGKFPLHTYSARFDDDPTISEGDYIDLVSASAGFAAHAVSPRGEEFVADSDKFFWHQEIPFISPSNYLEWRIHRLARETGTIVMIDGQGADELLGGYPSFFALWQRDLIASGRFMAFARATASLNRRLSGARRRYRDSERRFSSSIGLGARDAATSIASVVGKAIGIVLGRGNAQSVAEQRPGVPERTTNFRRRLAEYMLYDSLPEQLHSGDRNAMAFGVETRFPFLDHRLVDWCIGLPDDVLIEGGWQKSILRKAARTVIPPEVCWRPEKVGFRAPQDRWMTGALRGWIRERVFEGPVTELAAYDGNAVGQDWRLHQNGEADRSAALFRLASAGQWLSLNKKGAWKDEQPAPDDRARDVRIHDPLRAAAS
jgi:asparagine synthase (glutamine-hydrolysing)